VTGVSDAEEVTTPGPGPVEADVPAYRFGIVLALLFVTFVFLASGPTGDWVPFVSGILQGVTLLAALSAAAVSRRVMRLVLVVVILTLVTGLAVWLSGIEANSGVLLILNAALVAVAPLAIARALLRRGIIDLHTVMGALCVYVLLGMLWAFTFAAIGALGTGHFFAQQPDATVADFLYFSFVTLTTTGYGDLTAAHGFGRAVAVLEALLGQLYLVTVVAVVISRLARQPRSGPPPAGRTEP
jgi:hypothetical protein